MDAMIKLMVGLGNPGSEHDGTRHNAGFWWIDAVAEQLQVRCVPERAYHALAARLSTPTGTLWLLQPQTYMNLSGKSVVALARFFKIGPSQILVAHDELDLPAGEIKLKHGGGHAGHNGLRDIHAQLGASDYWRLRIGIGHPGDKAAVIGHVLGRPPAREREAIDGAIVRSLAALEDLRSGEMGRATALLHTTKPPRPKPARPAARPAVDGETLSAAPSPSAPQT